MQHRTVKLGRLVHQKLFEYLAVASRLKGSSDVERTKAARQARADCCACLKDLAADPQKTLGFSTRGRVTAWPGAILRDLSSITADISPLRLQLAGSPSRRSCFGDLLPFHDPNSPRCCKHILCVLALVITAPIPQLSGKPTRTLSSNLDSLGYAAEALRQSVWLLFSTQLQPCYSGLQTSGTCGSRANALPD